MAKITSGELTRVCKQRDAYRNQMYSEAIAERPDPGTITEEQRDMALEAVAARVAVAYALEAKPTEQYASLYDPLAMAYIDLTRYIADMSDPNS